MNNNGIDYTISNRRTGEKTFGGKSLHSIQDNVLNPYQKVICVFGETLEPFNRGENISVIGFGDSKCKDKSIFELKPGYLILIIVSDGQIPDEEPTTTAIIEASQYALSIILVGVGDGPWKTMKRFDDGLRARIFDNFQFVNFHEVMKDEDNPELHLVFKP